MRNKKMISFLTFFRQRFMAHKCALKGVEDYEVNGLDSIDVLKP